MAATPNWVMVENQFGSWDGPHMYAATDTDPCAKYPHAIWTQTLVKKIRPATDDEIDAMRDDDLIGQHPPIADETSVDDLIAARNYWRARAVEQEAYITDVAAIYHEIGRINDLQAIRDYLRDRQDDLHKQGLAGDAQVFGKEVLRINEMIRKA